LYDKEYFKAIEYFKEQWSPKNDWLPEYLYRW
jgi:hypothetical protein